MVLGELRIKQTKSRSRNSNDNTLAERQKPVTVGLPR